MGNFPLTFLGEFLLYSLIMKSTLCLFGLFTLFLAPAYAAVYAIDINDGNDPRTAVGWTGLTAVRAPGTSPVQGSVDIDGITFALASSDGSRLRLASGNPSPNALTADFAFDDGAGQALVLLFGGAGDLAAGLWQVEVWSHESSGGTGDQILGYRTNTTETVIITNLNDTVGSETIPSHTFTFTSDGVSAYDVFVRENNANDRSRLNAVRLTQIPEPSSMFLSLLGAGVLLRRRR